MNRASLVFAALLAVLLPLSLLAGRVWIDPFGANWPQNAARILAELRLPRAVLAITIGAGLGAAGAAMQEVAEEWQDWIVKMNRPTIDEIICAHLPDGSVPPKRSVRSSHSPPFPNRHPFSSGESQNGGLNATIPPLPTRIPLPSIPLPPPPGSSPRPAFPA